MLTLNVRHSWLKLLKIKLVKTALTRNPANIEILLEHSKTSLKDLASLNLDSACLKERLVLKMPVLKISFLVRRHSSPLLGLAQDLMLAPTQSDQGFQEALQDRLWNQGVHLQGKFSDHQEWMFKNQWCQCGLRLLLCQRYHVSRKKMTTRRQTFK